MPNVSDTEYCVWEYQTPNWVCVETTCPAGWSCFGSEPVTAQSVKVTDSKSYPTVTKDNFHDARAQFTVWLANNHPSAKVEDLSATYRGGVHPVKCPYKGLPQVKTPCIKEGVVVMPPNVTQ